MRMQSVTLRTAILHGKLSTVRRKIPDTWNFRIKRKEPRDSNRRFTDCLSWNTNFQVARTKPDLKRGGTLELRNLRRGSVTVFHAYSKLFSSVISRIYVETLKVRRQNNVVVSQKVYPTNGRKFSTGHGERLILDDKSLSLYRGPFISVDGCTGSSVIIMVNNCV